MIQPVLRVVADSLNTHLVKEFQQNEHLVVLGNILDPSGKNPVSHQNKLLLSIVHIQEVKILRNGPPSTTIHPTQPPIQLNIDFLVSASFDNYEEGLKILTKAISFFHQKPDWTPQNTPTLSQVDMVRIQSLDLSMIAMHDLWKSMGTTYRPSVIYSLRIFLYEVLPLPKLSTVAENIIK